MEETKGRFFVDLINPLPSINVERLFKKKIQFSSKSENQVQKVQEQILNQKNSNLNFKKKRRRNNKKNKRE